MGEPLLVGIKLAILVPWVTLFVSFNNQTRFVSTVLY